MALSLPPLSALAAKNPAVKTEQADVREKKPKASGPASIIAEEENLSTGLLQVQVMDFADQFMSVMGAALDEYIATEPDATRRVAAQYWKVRYASSAMAIAASRDPRTNLLDMVVFISVGKWAVDSYWVPKVFGKKSSALSEAYRDMDQKIWASARRVLSLRQESDLRELITRWERANPRIHEVADVRLRNLEGVSLSAFDDGTAARGILAGLRKFLGKVDSSLLYGERVMFYLQHTPHILSQQTDLTLLQIGEAFPIAAVKPDALANSIRDLPALLQEGLDRNQGSLNTLLPQIGTTLESANALAQNLDKTLLSVQELTRKTDEAGVLKTDPSLMVREASQALAHLDSSISGMNQLLERNAAGELKTAELTRELDARAGRLLDVAFQRILILLGVLFCGAFLLLLVAKWLFFAGDKPKPSA
ncbi:MAG: hypothetical protein ACOYM3_05370 [Terrimicrobiaceae bacterium]